MQADTQRPGSSAKPTSRVARKRLAVRERLFAAGLSLIAEHGLRQLTVGMIAECADCSVGAFYTHFESKDALIVAMKQKYLEQVGDALDAYQKTEKDPRKAIAVSMQYVLGLANRHPDWGRFVVETAWADYAFDKGFAVRALRDIRNGRDQGYFKIEDDIVALNIMSGAFLASLFSTTPTSKHTQEAQLVSRHVLQAFGVPLEEAQRIVEAKMPSIESSEF